MATTDTQQTAQFAAEASVSAAEAKQYLIEVQQGYQDISATTQEAINAATAAEAAKTAAETSEQSSSASAVASSESATAAAGSAAQAEEYANNASDYAQNKFTFYKTSSDPDGTIAGLAATTNGQSFRVAQGVDGMDAFITYQNDNGVAVAQAAQPGTAAVTGTIREFPTLAAAQADADAGNIPAGSTAYYRSPDDTALAIEVINNSGTLSATGRVMPSQGYVDVTISESIDKNDDSNLSKSITSDGITTELETESGEKFFSGMNESLQEMASRSWKDNTSNLHSATDRDGVQLVITDAEGKIRIPLTNFPLQDLLAQVQPVPGPFLNTLSSADKAAYGYIDELGGLNLPGLPTSVNNMLNGLSRRVQQQADGRFLTSIKDYGWDPNSQEDARQVIQRAIRDMARNPYGGVIYLPPGIYRLSSFLTPAPNVSIIGAGTGKTILMPYGSYSALQFT
ncbi:MAG: glycosyl hydrolase family 28-related protein, partial [Klebsiella oxytoca]|nr:glycosyl hydrolase family 28-related protein [Klebsiella oxytoca]